MNDSQQRSRTFAEAFPKDARVDDLVAAFQRGDYAHVRRAGTALARDASDEAVRGAARALVERTRPDRLTIALLIGAGLLLMTLSAWWMTHGKAPRSRAPSSHVEVAH